MIIIILIIDIDECRGLALCSLTEEFECVNTEGSYTCQCMVGYEYSTLDARCFGKLTTTVTCSSPYTCMFNDHRYQ
jgi:hypothetical protein